jgi:hypothetical protein
MSIYWPLGLFGVAALGGLVMAVRAFARKRPPWLLSVLHAVLGAAGLFCLFVVLADVADAERLPFGPLAAALGCLMAAAFGGFYLTTFHLRSKSHPRVGLTIHGIAALAGFAILAGVAFNMF